MAQREASLVGQQGAALHLSVSDSADSAISKWLCSRRKCVWILSLSLISNSFGEKSNLLTKEKNLKVTNFVE